MTPCGADFTLEGLCVGFAVGKLHGHPSTHGLANLGEAWEVGGEDNGFLDVIFWAIRDEFIQPQRLLERGAGSGRRRVPRNGERWDAHPGSDR